MRWGWPIKYRNGNHRNGHQGNGDDHNGEELNGFTGGSSAGFPVRWSPESRKPHGFISNSTLGPSNSRMPPVKELHYFDQLNKTEKFHPPRSRKNARDSSFYKRDESMISRFYLDLDSYGRLFFIRGHNLR